MGFVWFTLGALALFGLLSLLAAYMYGHFARQARGPVSRVLPREAEATLFDRQIGPLTGAHIGESGLVMLASNLDAFAARAFSARFAGRSLDLMYYIWKSDLTGRLLLNEVLAAAERGVRVRLLLDDIGIDNGDATLLALASHPNIELRLFNPTQTRDSTLRRGIEMALRAFSVTRRMHNKAWIVDGRLMIAGGRNIGDEYFDATEASTFRDLDLLAIGEVVEAGETMFDSFWNSGFALPVTALGGAAGTTLAALRTRLQHNAEGAAAEPYLCRVRDRLSLVDFMRVSPIHWTTEARLLYDRPEKVMGEFVDNGLMRELVPIFRKARARIDITSPYFIPGEEGTREFRALSGGGVAVRILTNSLAATDVAAVHGGYAPYRAPLLAGGVALYELRRAFDRRNMSLRGSSRASLHTKAFTVDDRIGFIGSLNFDPRSSSLNTEMGILFENAGLVGAMQQLFEAEISDETSYALALGETGRLEWRTRIRGDVVTFDREPDVGLSRRLIAWAVGLLPIESQL
ncbi:phospholipase D family protein [Sneathiella sp.]|uniref:phospholipase D family protein n=1 Tax=Sneathiella sp. TaxID=1964365 RepID=UPI002FE12FD5